MKSLLRKAFQKSVLLSVLVFTVPVQAGFWTSILVTNGVHDLSSATLLDDGQVLFAGGNPIQGSFNAFLYNPANGSCSLTGLMNTNRERHTATRLLNGKVLVTGGFARASAELYDPQTKTWMLAGNMAYWRYGHTATLLNNGTVLVTGGNSTTLSAEIYDPSTGFWTLTGSMNTNRVSQTVTLLTDGRVLVAGHTSSEVYDPDTGLWTFTGSMSTNFNVGQNFNFGLVATVLPNGHVLVTGGLSAETYNPDTGSWSPATSMPTWRVDHTATQLPSGSVLVAGGTYSGSVSVNMTSTLYDPSSGLWTPTANILYATLAPTATLLPSGKVLLPAGRNLQTYHSTNTTLKAVGNRNVNRQRHTATLLPDGNVLVAGGYQFALESGVELFDPLAQLWTEVSPMTTNREYHTATLLPSGKVLVAGGRKPFPTFASAELYDVQTQTWTPTGSMTTNRYDHTATLLRNGKVLVTGGAATVGYSAELYDPIAGTWTATSSMKTNRTGHTATLLQSGKVLVAGGNRYNAELYDPVTEQWTAAGATTASGYPAAVLLPNGRVLLVGTGSIAELYDPVTGLWKTTTSFNFRLGVVTATLLNDGSVLVAGDAPNGNSTAELFDPASERWAGIQIGSHSEHTATMLASGELLILGGNGLAGPDATNLLFSPNPGFSNSWQPQITFVTSPFSLGSSMVITGSQFRGVFGASKNTRDSSTDYPLVQLRSIESGQTMFLQTTNWSANSFTSLPVWNFPPGWAMTTVFVSGIPSTSSIVNITVPIPTTPTITETRKFTNGVFQLSFTNSVGAVFGALASTNVSLPLSSWIALGGVTEISPGQFQFTDLQATNSQQRFYRVRAN